MQMLEYLISFANDPAVIARRQKALQRQSVAE
jgi:hypothetical protein